MDLGIGKRIRQRRNDLNLTQDDLARRMGYKSKAAICKVENGEDNITTERISKFANALECSPGYLMGWEEAEAVDNPAIFEIEWRKCGGAAHRLILTKEEEEFILKVRSIRSFDADCLKRLLKYVISIEELYNANR